MKKQVRFVVPVLFAILIFGGFTNPASAQDAAKVDSAHYKVAFENDQVRVLRITYGPGEKSVMHEHPAGVVVFLTDLKGKFTFADGTMQDMTGEAGQTFWTPATKHQPENIGDEPFEVIQIEMKSKPMMPEEE